MSDLTLVKKKTEYDRANHFENILVKISYFQGWSLNIYFQI